MLGAENKEPTAATEGKHINEPKRNEHCRQSSSIYIVHIASYQQALAVITFDLAACLFVVFHVLTVLMVVVQSIHNSGKRMLIVFYSYRERLSMCVNKQRFIARI